MGKMPTQVQFHLRTCGGIHTPSRPNGPVVSESRLSLFTSNCSLLLPRGVASRKPLPQEAWVTVITMVFAGVSFSVATTHDYLAWNRARWVVGRDFVAGPMSTLDGGFEFNNYVDQRKALIMDGPKINALAGRSAASYVIAFSAPADSEILDRRVTGTWLPFSPSQVVYTVANPMLLQQIS